MKFVISVLSSSNAPSTRRALRFAQAVLAAGHDIVRVFFYQDGVLTASNNLVVAQDQQDIAKQWQAFIAEHELDAVVCIAAALRRGVLDHSEAQRYQRDTVNLAEGYQLSGLGQLHDALQQADRFISFGGE
ncbi:MAG: sulfurtransferase complex subunit TusD [Pseudomonas sp.]|jgi:tRNA 2-thiouridine synthesizing protein D|nr:sulfurtransferase complex subunit TusD [Pseudomonas sp.]MDD2223096.1 sulfurtransferase complex subunit TusD [Pseudomonas sp.]MDY0414907.1 sulfurtransferase complex subunit TusD [Pseudomonas sp.]NLO54826.1 sulfurtransferase complex subunit TusD [Gammaproteobacteria bacterium]